MAATTSPSPYRSTSSSTTFQVHHTSPARDFSANSTAIDGRQSVLENTDDVAVFIEDTLPQDVVKNLIESAHSPSAKGFLSPQRGSRNLHGGGDVATFREESSRPRPSEDGSTATGAIHCDLTALASAAPPSASKRRTRFSGRGAFGGDLTNATPTSGATKTIIAGGTTSTANPRAPSPPTEAPASPPTTVPTAPLAELHRVERERDRYRKMYEHQKDLAQVAMTKHQEDYDKLQEKIVETVALSSRLEESKRFIRQMKREVAAVRQRDLPYHNKKLEDSRSEAMIQKKFANIIRQQQQQFETQIADQQVRIDSLEKLLSHVTILAGMEVQDGQSTEEFLDSWFNRSSPAPRGGSNNGASPTPTPSPAIRWDLSKLDTLLSDSYYECTELVNELHAARRAQEKEVDRRVDLEQQVEELQKEIKAADINLGNERRKILLEHEHRAQSHAKLQTEVLEMRRSIVQLQDELTNARRRASSTASSASALHRRLQANRGLGAVRHGDRSESADRDDHSFAESDEEDTLQFQIHVDPEEEEEEGGRSIMHVEEEHNPQAVPERRSGSQQLQQLAMQTPPTRVVPKH